MTLKVTNTADSLLIETESPAETELVGHRLGGILFPGACLALFGELGSGKTVLARGIARGLGVGPATPVTSPTFVIVSEYQGRLPMHHVDAYRLRGEHDIVDLGSRELFFDRAVSVVEWADRIIGALPEERLDVFMAVSGTSQRALTLKPMGEAYLTLARALGDLIGSPLSDTH